MTPADKVALLDPRVRELAEEALRAHPKDFAAAVRVFREGVERDVNVLVALVTRTELDRIESACVQLVQKHEIGKSLREAVGRVPAPPAGLAERERWRTVREDAESVLWTFAIEGEWLGLCTRAKVEKEARVSKKRTAFLEALLGIMPPDPTAVVKDVITASRADQLWGRAPKAKAA